VEVKTKDLQAENQRLREENIVLKEQYSSAQMIAHSTEEEHANLRLKIQQLNNQVADLGQRIFILEHHQRELLRLIFQHKSERYIPSNQPPPEQLAFDFGELAPVDIEAEADLEEEKVKITYERRRQKMHPGRHPLPDHLPVEEIRIEPEELPENAEHIADTIVETLEYIPGSLFKKRYIFPRYVVVENAQNENAQNDDSSVEKSEGDSAETSLNEEEKTVIIQGKIPARPLPKSIAESGLLTHLIVSKFVYHLPFYRQIEQFKQLYDTTLRKSTVNHWFVSVCDLLKPLYKCLRQKVIEADYLQADESPIQVQDNDKKGKTHRGYQWVYHAPLLGLTLFEYQKGRGKNGPKNILEHFAGTLQTDGYEVYDKLVKGRQDIIQAGCMAHARRYFFKAKDSDPLAETALDYFGKLYQIERQIREQDLSDDLSDEQCLTFRKMHAQPVLNQLFDWAQDQYPKALPKSPFGKALYYLLQRKEKLTQYCRDGRIEIDNNLVENSIRPLALGRKNYLFAGSHDAAQRIAMMYSFFASCKKQGINPVTWLKFVLDNIAEHPINRIEELLPGKWVTEL
jgi:transposase